jgi:hypothetical protein
VHAREHARALFGQGEQGSTPSGAGVREQNADSVRERPDAAKVDRDNALRGGDAVLRTEDHGQERDLPGDDEKVGGEGLSSHEVWPQKGEALALACVSEQITGGERAARRGQGRAARFNKGGTNATTHARSRLGFTCMRRRSVCGGEH